ncbi:hypothetical protein BGZ70_001128 [Mortierella alpina]|uniref:Uncharacterized protein n=1 Tax=Mortierella alpina TaxID=64518 RepID=A0A9P6IWZ0_MORAP|nr:hypothetical protein BGZ70_001128 [Mortierella alpina]
MPSNPHQNTFTRPAATPVTVCGTVIGIDFTEEEFSVGFVNAADEVELIRNKDGDIYTPSYVRIFDRQDGSKRKILFGKDALTRPLNRREKKLKNAMDEALMKYSVENPVRNITLPVPDIYYQFEPDRAYGLGQAVSTNIIPIYWRTPPSAFIHTADGHMVVGDEWENVSPRSYGNGGYSNSTGECRGPMDAQAEYARKMREKAVERKLTVAGLLMGQAREMAEKHLKERVKFAVVTIPSPLDISESRLRLYSTTPPVPHTEGLVRGGLHFLRVLEQSEAAVLAYEPQIVKAEQASGGRPQIVVFYYLNIYGEGIAVFETSRDPAAEDLLRLKTVAKYHFYQSVRERMSKALARYVYEQYKDGSYKTLDTPRDDCEDCEYILDKDASDPKEQAMRLLQNEIRQLSDDSRSWPLDDPEDDAKEERLVVSMTEYVVRTRKQWRDFERTWLKTHFGAMLNRAYEKSGVEVDARPQRIDHFLIVDESRYRQRTSSIMREVLGGSAELNELADPAVEHKFGPIVSHGAARVADYLTKRSSLHSCL